MAGNGTAEILDRIDGLFPDAPEFDARLAYEELKEEIEPDDGVTATAVKNYFANTKNFACSTHAVINTLNRRYYKKFFARTPAEIDANYKLTFRHTEKGRGRLNMMKVVDFPSLNDPHLIKRFAEHAATSYCGNTTAIKGLADLNLRVGRFTIVGSGDDIKDHMNYYTAYNQDTQTLVFVFRGSMNRQDELLDLLNINRPMNLTTMPLKNVANVTEAQVHAGFWGRFALKREDVTRLLDSSLAHVREKYKPAQLSFVTIGHSLGAAWAFLQAADWAARGYPLTALYSYGQPLVANQLAADAMAETIGYDRYIRVVNRNDLIVHIGFPHGAHPAKSDEIWVPYVAGEEDKPVPDMMVCKGGQDPKCSLSVPCMHWDWHHHAELEDFSQRSDYCRMGSATDNSVYDAETSPRPQVKIL